LGVEGLKIGDKIISGSKASFNVGNCMELRHIQIGLTVHNVELRPGKGGQLARSAGTYATIKAYNPVTNYVDLQLQSGEIRKVLGTCRATIGKISNENNNLVVFGKAGKSR